MMLGVLLVVVSACDGGNRADLTGEELAAELGCLACHSETGTGTGPRLQGIWGTEVQLADGRTVVADEDYVRQSITEPTAAVVDGYNPIMPTFRLSDDEVERLVDWVRSIG